MYTNIRWVRISGSSTPLRHRHRLPAAGAAVHAHVRHHPGPTVHPATAREPQPLYVPVHEGEVATPAVARRLIREAQLVRCGDGVRILAHAGHGVPQEG